jgi:hypothetical protein
MPGYLVAQQLIFEAAKMILQLYFNYMRLAGKTEEEAQQIYLQEREAFNKNHPSKLPDV